MGPVDGRNLFSESEESNKFGVQGTRERVAGEVG